MKKIATRVRMMIAATLVLGGGQPILAIAADVHSVQENALGLDTLLRQGALLQQAVAAFNNDGNPASWQHNNSTHNSAHNSASKHLLKQYDLFAQYGMSDFEQEPNQAEPAQELRSRFSTLGGEKRLSEQWVAGARYGRLEQSLQLDSGDTTHDADSVGVYSRWLKNGFTATATLDYGRGELESSRALDSGSAFAETDTQEWLLGLAGRYAFRKEGWCYGPFSRLEVSRGSIDAYTEYAGADVTRLEARDADSRILTMGVHASYLFTSSAGVISPYAILSTRKEFETRRSPLESTYLSAASSSFSSLSATPYDSRWHEVGAGISLAIDNAFLISAEFEKSLDLYQQDQESLHLKADWIFL